ncbi:MAG: SDR family oxidoreductase [Microgenomates group bacterium]
MHTHRQHIVVTGGAGYIGSVLIPRLLRENYNITVFDTFYFGKKSIHAYKDRIKIIQGDVRKPPKNLFRGVDAVIHLAALSNDPTAEFNPEANAEINTAGTQIIAEMAKQQGVKRFIFASSCSIYDLGLEAKIAIKNENSKVCPKNPYSKSKYLAEQALLQMASPTFSPIILRKGTVFGYSPRMRYDLIINTMVRDAICTKQLHIFCQGKQWRPLVAIEDVAEAYMLALKKPRMKLHGKIINIASGNYRVEEVAKEVQKVFHDSFHEEIQLIYEQAYRPDRSYCVSMKRAKKVLDFESRHTMSASIYLLVKIILKHQELRKFKNPVFYNIERMKPILQHIPLFSI